MIELFPTGGGPRTPVEAFPVDPEALASDGAALYVKLDEQTVCVIDCRASGTNALFRIDAAGQATVLARWAYPPGNSELQSAEPPPGTQHLVLDEQHVYALEQPQGQRAKTTSRAGASGSRRVADPSGTEIDFVPLNARAVDTRTTLLSSQGALGPLPAEPLSKSSQRKATARSHGLVAVPGAAS
jgi:hypothetical protein